MTQLDAPASSRSAQLSCSNCNLRELCLPGGCLEDLERVENIVYARRRVKRGETLFSAGDEFNAVYAIRSGFFKTCVVDGEGPRHRRCAGCAAGLR